MGTIVKGESVIVSLGDCKLLTEYRTKPNIKYKSGYDVRGKIIKKVEYEEVTGPKLSKAVTFDIVIDISNKYSLGERNLAAKIRTVAVKIKNGKVFLNNYLLSKKNEDDLATRCRSILNSK